MANTPPPADDVSDILARYPDDISDILARHREDGASTPPAKTGWMPAWLKHGLVGGVSDLLSQASMSDPATMGNAITSEQAQHEIESQFTGAAPQPEGFLGRGASDVVRMATQPASWIGPGGAAAKAAFLAASGYGGEAGGTLAEKARLGPAGQTVARVAGSLTPAAGLGLIGAARAPRVRAAQAATEREAAATQAAAANQAAAREFDIQMSRGKASGDLEAIRYEDLAARGAHGTPAQDIAAPFFDKEFQDVQAANRRIGEGFARGYSTAENPSEAAARINAELGAQGEQARTAVQAAEDAARREAAAARGMVDDQGRAISNIVAGGRPPIENPREAGEIVGQAVRSAAARARAGYQGLYDEAFGLSGQFHPSTFEGIGTRIQGRLSWGSNNPVIIDDVTTPIASRAIRDLENVSGLRFQNRADPLSAPPHGAPPENYLPVDLRGVDQARKRLVAYYRGARSSPNASDARAVGRLIEEFDNEIEQSIANGLFSGDSRALGAVQQARAAYSRYARQFRPQQSGDDVGLAMRRIIDRNATPEEIANMIVGSGRIGNSGLPVRMADRLEGVLGRDTEAWSLIREAIWQKASRVRGEAGGVNTQGIDDLVGSSLGRRVFSDAERNAMRTHSAAVRTLDDVIETLGATQAARRAQDEYQRIFSGQDIGGQQARVFRRIIDGTATPEETAQAVFSTISGNPGNARRVIGAIEGIVGRDSETMALVRDEVWRRLTQNAATKDQPGYQKVSQAIGEFLEGRGRSVATMLYTPEEIALMQRYQAVLKRLVIPKNARTNSDTAPALLQALRSYGSAITATLGHSVDKVIGKVAGSAVKALIRESANVIGNARAAYKVARSLSPIDLPPPTSTPGPRSAAEASPLIKALSRGLATQGADRNFITDSRGNRYNYARGGRTDRPSKAEAHYRLGNNNKRCEICTMFRAPHKCTAITGKVSKIGLCDLFERKRAYAEGGEVADYQDIGYAPDAPPADGLDVGYVADAALPASRDDDYLRRLGVTEADEAQAAREAAAARVAQAARPVGGRREGPPVALRDAEGRTQAAYVADQMLRGFGNMLATPGTLAKGTAPATPSEEDQFRANQAAETPYGWGPGMGLQIVAGGVPGAQVGRAGIAGGKLPQPSPSAPTFYSAVEKTVDNVNLPKAPPEQWLGTLRNAPGVKAEELEWIGLPEWLQQQKGPVSKQAVQDFIAQNKVNVEEVVKGRAGLSKEQQMELDSLRSRGAPNGVLAPEDALTAPEWRRLEFLEAREEGGGNARFSQYQLPGGENYRELLLTLPAKRNSSIADIQQRMRAAEREMPRTTQAERNAFNIKMGELESQLDDAHNIPEFRSTHWPDDLNPVAHVRFNDRVIGGKKTLHLEEVQSDWHQKGRKQGYESPQRVAQSEAIGRQLEELNNQWKDTPVEQRGLLMPKFIEQMNALHEQRTALLRDNPVPDAPFKTTWPELVLKRMIRYAAENGYDRISWAPGEVQAARYDLSKHIGKLEAWENRNLAGESDGTWSVVAHDPSGRRVINEGPVETQELPNLVGKELADKITDQGGGTFRGLDLKVGGEGMRSFYDRELVNLANKLSKKHGARVEQNSLPKPPAPLLPAGEVMPQSGGRWKIQWDNGSFSGGYGSRESAETALRLRAEKIEKQNATPGQVVHTMDITPALREAAMGQGFPLFVGGKSVVPVPDANRDDRYARRRARQGFARGGRGDAVQFLAKMRAAMGGRASHSL